MQQRVPLSLGGMGFFGGCCLGGLQRPFNLNACLKQVGPMQVLKKPSEMTLCASLAFFSFRFCPKFRNSVLATPSPPSRTSTKSSAQAKLRHAGVIGFGLLAAEPPMRWVHSKGKAERRVPGSLGLGTWDLTWVLGRGSGMKSWSTPDPGLRPPDSVVDLLLLLGSVCWVLVFDFAIGLPCTSFYLTCCLAAP